MPGPDTFVRIPKERVGILIGPEGKVKKEIECKLNVKLDIDKEGSVTIKLPENIPDPSVFLRAKDIVTAIGRGFTPKPLSVFSATKTTSST
jgi:ribosomal RNA assembly protein